ncbi:alpha-L-fucosidase, partial [Listeria monocytogenes]
VKEDNVTAFEREFLGAKRIGLLRGNEEWT